tara:strand:- start:341 stop:508 length:168 start_codon:yes stop_codon:yes gene_type:complete
MKLRILLAFINVTIGNRQIFASRVSDNMRLTIFVGGHELLEEAAINDILSSIRAE